MGIRHGGSNVRKHHATSDIDGAPPMKKVKSVSAGSIFREHAQKTKVGPGSRAIAIEPSSTREEAAIVNAKLSSSHSSHKSKSRASKKQLDIHPLLTEFKDASKHYRRNLYVEVSQQINETQNRLITELREGVSTKPTHPDSHPRLTVAKYIEDQSAVLKPLSQSIVRTTNARTRADQAPHTETTIDARIAAFDKQNRKQREEIVELQARWETIVREIFLLGSACLGEDTMKALLLPSSPTPAASSSPTDPESVGALFVPEKPKSKKKVSFTNNGNATVGADAHAHATVPVLPPFLYRPSVFKNRIAPATPRIVEAEVVKLQKDVEGLGDAQTEKLKEIERKYVEWWKKKAKSIASVLGDD